MAAVNADQRVHESRPRGLQESQELATMQCKNYTITMMIKSGIIIVYILIPRFPIY